MASEFILETHGLTKQFAGFYAVRDVNLQIRRGTIHALIGPNGAGKTTCFNLLTKFLQPSAGRERPCCTTASAWIVARLLALQEPTESVQSSRRRIAG